MKQNQRHMWQMPWQYKESAAFVISLVSVGFALQLTRGAFNFYLLHTPVNLIFCAAFVLAFALCACIRKNPVIIWLSGVPLAVSLIAGLLFFSLIMGTTPQLSQTDTHGNSLTGRLGFSRVTSAWAFVLLYFMLLVSLGLAIMRRIMQRRKRDYAFLLNHAGLWIVLAASGLGAADMQRYVMHVPRGETEWRVYNALGQPLELPLAIKLNRFDMEEYPAKLAVIHRESGIPQPEGKSGFLQLVPGKTQGTIADWDISVETYLPQAVRNSNSTYRELAMPGSAQAAYVKARNKRNAEVAQGWVSGGNMSQMHMLLPLGKEYALAMTQAEPKRFVSDITVYTREGLENQTLLEVNKPLAIGNWMIYQYGYDARAGRLSSYSSFDLVFDPWLYPAYFGFILMAAGAFSLVWARGKPSSSGITANSP